MEKERKGKRLKGKERKGKEYNENTKENQTATPLVNLTRLPV